MLIESEGSATQWTGSMQRIQGCTSPGVGKEQIGLIWGTHQDGLVELDDSVQTRSLERKHAGTGPVRQFGLGLGIRTRQIDSLRYQETEAGQHE